MVVFPDPLPPRITLVSPAGTSNEMPVRTRRPPNVRSASLSEIMASPGRVCIDWFTAIIPEPVEMEGTSQSFAVMKLP
jgi:hypothetical protein